MQDFRAATEDARLAQLSGSIERVIYANEENGYAVCDLGTDDNDLVTIQGTLPYIAEGDGVTVYGPSYSCAAPTMISSANSRLTG